MKEKFYPCVENLGKNCQFWNLFGRFAGCNFPKAEMEGRTSCEGEVDEVCLYLKDGRFPKDPNANIHELKLQPPRIGQKPHIPPSTT